MKCLLVLVVSLLVLGWIGAFSPPLSISRTNDAVMTSSTSGPHGNCNSDNSVVAEFQTSVGSKNSVSLTNPVAAPASWNAIVRTSWRPIAANGTPLPCEQWPGGMARLRVRGGSEGTTDYGSAVCVGYGRRPGEWTFLSCSHNFESGGEPELQLGGRWVPATLLYRDKLAEAVQTGPGQYTRVEAGPDRSVLVVNWSGRLRFRQVSLERYVGEVVLSGYPSSPSPVTIAGQTESHPNIMRAALERPSQGGFSGGGVFDANQHLVGIWTSGSKGTGYGHYVFEFLPIFRELGWAPGNWQVRGTDVAQRD